MEKRVGFGLVNILMQTLYDTGRFIFLEEKEAILKRIVDLWQATEAGILVRTPGASAPRLLTFGAS